MVEVLDDLVIVANNGMTAIRGDIARVDAGCLHVSAYTVAIANNHRTARGRDIARGNGANIARTTHRQLREAIA